MRSIPSLVLLVCLGVPVLAVPSGQAAPPGFEPPSLASQNQEGAIAAFALYPRLALAGIPDSAAAVVLWSENRFPSSPFETALLGKALLAQNPGPDHLLGFQNERLLPETFAVWAESIDRVHVIYATRTAGESLLVHRLTDSSLEGGSEEVLDRWTGYLGQPAAVAGSTGELGVCYRRDEDLVFLSLRRRAPPLVVAVDARPSSFAIAASGGSFLVAFAGSQPQALPDRLVGRIELIELRGSEVRSRTTLVDSPGLVTGVAMASSPQGRVGLAWSDDRYSVPQLPNSEVFCRVRTPAGRWSDERRMTQNLAESYAPALAWDEDERLHLVWQDHMLGAPEIFHRLVEGDPSIDSVSTQDGSPSVTPQAVFVAGRLVVVWRDAVEGRADLYFTRQQAQGSVP